MTKHPRLAILIAIFSLLIGLLAATRARVADGQAQSSIATNSSDRFAYMFDCAGQYIRIDLNTGQHTEPRNVPGIVPGIVLVPGGRGFDGCLIDAIAFDPESSIVYAMMQKERFDDSDGNNQDKVVALQLPNLRALSSIDIPLRSSGGMLRYDSVAQKLAVSYDVETSANYMQFVISTQRPDHLEFERRSGSSGAAGREVAGPIPSDDAYTDSSGKIVDGSQVIAVNGAWKTINGYDLLTDSLREQFKSLERTGVTGKQLLEIVFADSAAGRMVFIVGSDEDYEQSPSRGGLVVYDAVKEKVVSSINTPYAERGFDLDAGTRTPTVHLTPNGQIIVVEEYQRHSSDRGGGQTVQERFKTGEIALYNATSGRPLGTIQLDPAPGDSGSFVGFSPDSTLMYYASSQNMYVVDLSQGHTLTLKMPRDFGSPIIAFVTSAR